MPILTVKSKRDAYKLVGVQVPPRVHNYLTLYTLARGITKAELLSALIEGWMEGYKANMSEKELIKELSKRIDIEWKELKQKKPRANFDEFKSRLKYELTKKGLEEQQIAEILIKLIK